jgi:hypothetical protein
MTISDKFNRAKCETFQKIAETCQSADLVVFDTYFSKPTAHDQSMSCDFYVRFWESLLLGSYLADFRAGVERNFTNCTTNLPAAVPPATKKTRGKV